MYATAASGTTPKFVNLDMEEYRDLHLTLEVFERFAMKLPKLRISKRMTPPRLRT